MDTFSSGAPAARGPVLNPGAPPAGGGIPPAWRNGPQSPGGPPGSVNWNALPPDTVNAANNYLSAQTDDDRRQAIQTLSEQARQNQDLLDLWSNVAGDPAASALWQDNPTFSQQIRRGALDVMEQNQPQLSEQNLRQAVGALGEPALRDGAQRLLTGVQNTGTPEQQGWVRDAAAAAAGQQAPGGVGGNFFNDGAGGAAANDLVATGSNPTTEADFRGLLQNGAAPQGTGAQAYQRIQSALQSSPQGPATAALRSTLGDANASLAHRNTAARLFAENPGAMTADMAPLFQQTAEAGSTEAVNALRQLATRESPVQDAIHSIGGLADNAQAPAEVRSAAQQAAVDVFQNAGVGEGVDARTRARNQETRTLLARQVASAPTVSNETASQAIRTIADWPAGGDMQAVSSLQSAMGNGRLSEDVRREAATALGSATLPDRRTPDEARRAILDGFGSTLTSSRSRTSPDFRIALDTLRDTAVAGSAGAAQTLADAYRALPASSTETQTARRGVRVSDTLTRMEVVPAGSQRGDVLQALGDIGAGLPENTPANDPRISAVREGLRHAAQNGPAERTDMPGIRTGGSEQAIAQMGRIARFLEPSDHRMLADALGSSSPAVGQAALRTLGTAAEFDNFDREAMFGRMREQGSLRALMPNLRTQDLPALDQLIRQDWANDRFRGGEWLGQLMTASADPGVQRGAAERMLDPQVFPTLSSDQRTTLAEGVRALGDRNLTQTMQGRLQPSPLANDTLQQVTQQFQQRFGTAIANAQRAFPTPDATQHQPDDSRERRTQKDLARLGYLLGAQQMGADLDNPTRLEVDMSSVQSRIDSLMRSPGISQRVEWIRQDLVEENAGLAEQSERYLGSDDFRNRLQLASPGERQAIIQDELTRLGALAPDRAARAADQLQETMFRDSPLEAFGRMEGGPRAQQEALQATIAHRLAVNGSQVTSEASVLVAAINRLAPGTGASRIGPEVTAALQNELQATTDPARRGVLTRTLGLMQGFERSGGLGSTLTAANLVALGATTLQRPPSEWTARDWTAVGMSGLSTVASASDMARVTQSALGAMRLTGASAGAGRVAAAMAPFRHVATPLAAVGGAINVYDAARAFNSGDTHAGVGNSASAVGAGLMLLAPATGPAAPFLLAGGLLLGVGGAVYSRVFGRSPEDRAQLDYYQSLGVRQSAPREYDRVFRNSEGNLIRVRRHRDGSGVSQTVWNVPVGNYQPPPQARR